VCSLCVCVCVCVCVSIKLMHLLDFYVCIEMLRGEELHHSYRARPWTARIPLHTHTHTHTHARFSVFCAMAVSLFQCRTESL